MQKTETQRENAIGQLSELRITGLFGRFNYRFVPKSGGITILTGPNGYGKTTILRILHSLSERDWRFFIFGLDFKKIEITIESGEQLSIHKEKGAKIEIKNNSDLIFSFYYRDMIKSIADALNSCPNISKLDTNTYFDLYSGRSLTLGQAIEKIPSDQLRSIFDSIIDFSETTPLLRTYLIKEQRLIRENPNFSDSRHSLVSKLSGLNPLSNTINGTALIETVDEFAKDLCLRIRDTQIEYGKVSQDLDSTFPQRLFNQTDGIEESESEQRLQNIRSRQELLREYGLLNSQEYDTPVYKEENAKALRVYIDLAEAKLSVFDDLLKKISLLRTVVSKRDFAFKSFHVDPEKGFFFLTDTSMELSLKDLSSGEKQELVLLYDILFNVEPGTLLLLDEPELSLHVAWQHEFVDDFAEIVRFKKISAILATHSPQIIGNHWDDMVVDLWELSGEQHS